MTAIDKPRCSCGSKTRFIPMEELFDAYGRTGHKTFRCPDGWTHCQVKMGYHAPEAE